MQIVYIGPDAGDAALTRRVRGFSEAGAEVTCFAFERSATPHNILPTEFHSLGEIENGDFLRRAPALARAIGVLTSDESPLRTADLVYCRNLDMALVGAVARALIQSNVKLVYEVLDLHPLTVGRGFLSYIFRWIERRILSRIQCLVVSSEGFHSGHFGSTQSYCGDWFVLENKLLFRPENVVVSPTLRPPPLVIGMFGKFRCQESIQLLTSLAQRHREGVRIRLAGVANPELENCVQLLRDQPNVEDYGPYSYPADLSEIYHGIHLNWGLDLSGGVNAKLLLPNRIYEGGAFGVPLIAETDTETAKYIIKHELGVAIEPPFDAALDNLVEQMTYKRIRALKEKLNEIPSERFFTHDDHRGLLVHLNTSFR
jgi:succinoglycan biosynthesis protein ExoL